MEIVLLDDRELVRRSLSGDSVAYEALFERHRSSLHAMLASRCSGTSISKVASCDDILQEAFVKAYLNLEKYDPQYTFAQWIFTIARNLFIDYTRRHVALEPYSNENESADGACSAPNPEEQVIAKQDNRRLHAALERLTPSYQAIVELRFWCDMSYEQISERLSIPLGTVKTQIHRARRAFIRELGSSFDDRK